MTAEERGSSVINVCIVEDQTEEAKRLEEHLTLFGEQANAEFAVSRYDSGEAMLGQYAPRKFDIVFLDIMLPGMTGMEIARELRRRDERDIIIFVTNEQSLAVEGYAVDALDYIVKPVKKYAFFATMERVLRHLGRSASIHIKVDTAEGPRFLDAAEITYVEVFNHTLVYHTGTQEFQEWASLKKAEEMLGQYGFERCNSNHLVNLRFVKAVMGEELIVAGKRVKLTRSRRQAFLRRLNEFYMT